MATLMDQGLPDGKFNSDVQQLPDEAAQVKLREVLISAWTLAHRHDKT